TMALRVSVKNTFLTFDECEGEESPEAEEGVFASAKSRSKAASPRSRSLECSSPTRKLEDFDSGQVSKLNKLLDDDQVVIKECFSP
ncbi:unnamed protein product, partial [Polarella glacialis]